MFAYYTLIYIFLVLVWAGIVYLLFLTVQNRRYRAWLEKQKMTTILLKVPKNNEKTALSAEQMYASLHGILRDKWKLFVAGELQEHFSFEIVSSSKYIKFYATVPNQLVDFLEGQIYAQYPTLLIEKVGDYVVDYDRTGRNFASCELVLDRNEVYPIRTFDSFEVDPLAGVTAVLSKLGDSKNQIWIQFLMRPVDNSWQSKCKLQVKKIKGEASKGGIWGMMWRIVSMLIQHVITSGAGDTSDGKSSAKELTAPEEEAIKGIYEKSTKLGYQSKIRVVCFADDKDDAKSKINSIVGTFKQFSITNMNGFSARRINVNKKNDLDAYEKRSFWDKGYILNVKELASLFHLPSIAVATPAIVWSTAKTAEPPSNLPTIANTNKDDLTIFACTNFRGLEHNFGLKIGDRSHHTYIVGKTGMGKTSLLQNMVIDDIRKGRGVAVVDPHGDFVDTVLDYIPKSRINDVILFDPGDKDNPVAFNLLEQVDDDYKPIIASGLVGIFKKLFADSWGPRLEHILRYTFLALLDYPGSTFLSVPRILTDEYYRAEVLKKVKDPVVRDFWLTEFEGYPDKIRQEAVMPIQNKVGQFLASATIRNIIGQPVTSMNIRQIMDESKIFLVKVSKGIVGEDNSALLGATMVTKIQLAAMSRQDIPRSQRVPFNLYVDEFQNFATESFASILSEARKYNLNLHVANQYIAQMEDSVREAIFGNVGTLITFRVGANDAEHLSKEFTPTFSAEDLTNLERYQIYLRMTIDGISSSPFSATTLPLPKFKTNNVEKIWKVSRERYSSNRDFVEKKLRDWASELDKNKEEGDLKNKQQKYNKKKKPFFSFNNQTQEEKVVNIEMTEEQKKKQSSLIDKLKKFQEAKKPTPTLSSDIPTLTDNNSVDIAPAVSNVKRDDTKNKLLISDEKNKHKVDYVRQRLNQLKNIDKTSNKITTHQKTASNVNKKEKLKETIPNSKNNNFKKIGEITISSDGIIEEGDNNDISLP